MLPFSVMSREKLKAFAEIRMRKYFVTMHYSLCTVGTEVGLGIFGPEYQMASQIGVLYELHAQHHES